MTAAPRVAVVTWEPPFPPSSGGQLRVLQHVQVMRRIGYDVAVLAFADRDGESAPPGVALGRTVPYRPETAFGKLRRFAAAGMLAQHPHWRRIAVLEPEIVQTLRLWQPDAVVLEYSLLAGLLPAVRRELPDAVVIVDAHNTEGRFLRELLAASRSVRSRLRHWLELRGMARIESANLPDADEVWVPSDLDAAALRSAGVAHVKVVPNAIDTDAYMPRGGEEAGVLTFTGIFNHLPNIDAAEWFCREIFPTVQAQHPNAHLYLVGKHAAPVQHLAGPAVTVTGFVADPRDYLRRASVVVVPLRYGGGTRLKILEAQAMGRAVVSTSKGAEGLAVTNRVDILLADDPTAFAQAIVQLLVDRSMRVRLGRLGRALVEASYSWRAMEEVMRTSALRRLTVPVATP